MVYIFRYKLHLDKIILFTEKDNFTLQSGRKLNVLKRKGVEKPDRHNLVFIIFIITHRM